MVQGPPPAQLDVFLWDISLSELLSATKRIKDNKACGPDDHPVEFWQAILKNGDGTSREGAQFLVGFCNAILHQSSVATSWHLQRFALIYKKRDPADCSNYRPICLLNAAYKIFAMVILQRLLRTGADEHIGSTQFGLRKSEAQKTHCIAFAAQWSALGRNVTAVCTCSL